MSSKKKDLANDLARGRMSKKVVTVTDEQATEVVKKVVKIDQKEEKERTVRTTLDLPISIHTAIKVKVAQDMGTKSIKEYVIRLVKKDLDMD